MQEIIMLKIIIPVPSVHYGAFEAQYSGLLNISSTSIT